MDITPRTGVDMIRIDRIERSITRHGERFLNRLFTRAEQDYCSSRATRIASLAARFAAKEAVMKLLGRGLFDIPLTDIEVVSGANGRPAVLLHRIARQAADDIGVTVMDISISHEKEYAIATAFAIARRPTDQPNGPGSDGSS